MCHVVEDWVFGARGRLNLPQALAYELASSCEGVTAMHLKHPRPQYH